MKRKKLKNQNLRKKCKICKETKEFTLFNKNSTHSYGVRNDCRVCYNKMKKEKYPKYKKNNIKQFLLHTYGNMKGRVEGKKRESDKKYYLGLPILNKEEFLNWAINDINFLRIHKNWVINNYDTRLSPSINRIDPRKGYTLNNIEWMTHSMNCRLANVTKINNDKAVMAIYRAVGVKKNVK